MAVTMKKGPKKDVYANHLGDIPKPPQSSHDVEAYTTISKKKALEPDPFVESTTYEKVMKTGLIPLHVLAHVSVEGSSTINMGNYESAKVTVGITMPCHKDEINDVYEFTSDWVSEKLIAATKGMKGGE